MRAHDDERLARTVSARPVSARPAFSGRRVTAAATAPGLRGSGGAVRTRRAAFPLPAGFVASLVAAALGCAQLTSPPSTRSEGGAAGAPGSVPPQGGAAPGADVREVAERLPPTAAAATPSQIEAAHILVSYQGATRAKPTVTRTRDEARTLAAQLALRAREPGADFAALAKDVSDGPSGVEGGALPRFGRQQMVKPFSDAAFALQPGEVSSVVETNFGFHIIKRVQ